MEVFDKNVNLCMQNLSKKYNIANRGNSFKSSY